MADFIFPGTTLARADLVEYNRLTMGSGFIACENWLSSGKLTGNCIEGFVAAVKGYVWNGTKDHIINFSATGNYYVYIKCDTAADPMFSLEYSATLPSDTTGVYYLPMFLINATASGSTVTKDLRTWLWLGRDTGWQDVDLIEEPLDVIRSVQYRIVGGVCFLRGTLKPASITNKIIASTGALPLRCRPDRDLRLPITTQKTPDKQMTEYYPAILSVGIDGSLVWAQCGGSAGSIGDYVNLECSWPLEIAAQSFWQIV